MSAGQERRMREVVLVVARACNGGIGHQGALPWHLPADLKRFKAITVGKPVVMGRKTFESIGRPLPGRHNIVLTRDAGWAAPGVTIVPNLAEAIAATGLDPRIYGEIMIIGGAQIYAQALPLAHRIELTEVDADPPADTFLPDFPEDVWQEVAREPHPPADGRPGFAFVTLRRRQENPA